MPIILAKKYIFFHLHRLEIQMQLLDLLLHENIFSLYEYMKPAIQYIHKSIKMLGDVKMKSFMMQINSAICNCQEISVYI